MLLKAKPPKGGDVKLRGYRGTSRQARRAASESTTGRQSGGPSFYRPIQRERKRRSDEAGSGGGANETEDADRGQRRGAPRVFRDHPRGLSRGPTRMGVCRRRAGSRVLAPLGPRRVDRGPLVANPPRERRKERPTAPYGLAAFLSNARSTTAIRLRVLQPNT